MILWNSLKPPPELDFRSILTPKDQDLRQVPSPANGFFVLLEQTTENLNWKYANPNELLSVSLIEILIVFYVKQWLSKKRFSVDIFQDV